MCNGLPALLLFQLLSCWEQFLGFSLDAVRLLFGILLSDTHTESHHTHFPSCAKQKNNSSQKDTNSFSEYTGLHLLCDSFYDVQHKHHFIDTGWHSGAAVSTAVSHCWVGQGRVGGVPMFRQCPYRSCLGAPASSHSGDFKWVVGVNGLSVTHSPGVHQLDTSLKWKDGFHFTRRNSAARAPLGPLTLSWSQMDHTGGFLFNVIIQRHHICSSRGQMNAVNMTSTPLVLTFLQHCHRLFSLSCSLCFFLFVVLSDLFLLKRSSSSPLSPDSAHRESCDCRGSVVIIVVASTYSLRV